MIIIGEFTWEDVPVTKRCRHEQPRQSFVGGGQGHCCNAFASFKDHYDMSRRLQLKYFSRPRYMGNITPITHCLLARPFARVASLPTNTGPHPLEGNSASTKFKFQMFTKL